MYSLPLPIPLEQTIVIMINDVTSVNLLAPLLFGATDSWLTLCAHVFLGIHLFLTQVLQGRCEIRQWG